MSTNATDKGLLTLESRAAHRITTPPRSPS